MPRPSELTKEQRLAEARLLAPEFRQAELKAAGLLPRLGYLTERNEEETPPDPDPSA